MASPLIKAACAALIVSCVPMLSAKTAEAGAMPCIQGSGGLGSEALDLVNDGCTVSKNDPLGVYSPPGGDSEAGVEQAILMATNVAIDLSLFGKVEAGKDLGLIELTPVKTNGEGGILTGEWKVLADDVFIKYITVKAATGYVLYELAGNGAQSGIFTTEALRNRGGQIPGMSHISFWISRSDVEVPEPATLGLIGAGLLGLGMTMRRRKTR